MKIGIFIGRMQPLHLGHQKIIEKSIESNDFTFIFLGSSGIINEYNPFTDEERKTFVQDIFTQTNKYKLLSLHDTDSDELWLKNIEKLVKNNLDKDIGKVIFYGGDFENDYAIKVVKQYINILDFDNIDFEEISRKEIFIKHNGEKIHISSTKVRQYMKDKDFELLEKMLDYRVFEQLKNKYLN